MNTLNKLRQTSIGPRAIRFLRHRVSGLLRSRLYLLLTGINVAIAALAWPLSGSASLALLWFLGMQVLTTVVIWQYMKLVEKIELSGRHTHRLLGEIGTDVSIAVEYGHSARSAFNEIGQRLVSMEARMGKIDRLESELGKVTTSMGLSDSPLVAGTAIDRVVEQFKSLEQTISARETPGQPPDAEIAVAIDRMNLQVRRQLALIRREISRYSSPD